LHFEWKETGGPAVKESAPAGVGRTLIESAIPGAQVKREFRGEGLVCTIDAPLGDPQDKATGGASFFHLNLWAAKIALPGETERKRNSIRKFNPPTVILL